MDSKALLDTIANDLASGGRDLACRAVDVIVEYAGNLDGNRPQSCIADTLAFADKVSALRPSMLAIENLVGRWREEALARLAEAPDGPSFDQALNILRTAAQRVTAEARRATALIAEHAVAQLEHGDIVLTHSRSATVLAIFERARNLDVAAIVTESRPGNEGAGLARALSDLDIPVEYVTDAQMALAASRATKVMVGADAVFTDGAFINKTGTHLLALAALDAGVPLFVCCEQLKSTSRPAAHLLLEEMDPAELGLPPLPGVHPRNVYFEVTPAQLVTAWISEAGVRWRVGVPEPDQA